MAKRTAIIDIGSNSMRMVMYEKSSRFAFHKLGEFKSPVKLGKGSFNAHSTITDEAYDNAYNAINEFIKIAHLYKCKKIMTVATSALRDATNKEKFLAKVKKNLNIAIKLIDGNKEAYLGALSAINLLNINNAITVDIGGGSTELAIIKDGKIQETVSLQLGTLRINANIDASQQIITQQLSTLQDQYQNETVIAIGGSARAISTFLQKQNAYPLHSLHGYQYDVDKSLSNIQQIYTNKEISKHFSYGRNDTIKQGAMILSSVLQTLGAKNVTVSRYGVREGVYLADLLRTQNERFPLNFSLSTRSLQDRFSSDLKIDSFNAKIVISLYAILSKFYHFKEDFSYLLGITSKLFFTDQYFKFHKIDLNEFSHKQRVLISFLLQHRSKKIDEKLFLKYQQLLPAKDTLLALVNIIQLTICLVRVPQQKINFEMKENTLIIAMPHSYLAKECISSIVLPFDIKFI